MAGVSDVHLRGDGMWIYCTTSTATCGLPLFGRSKALTDSLSGAIDNLGGGGARKCRLLYESVFKSAMHGFLDRSN